MKSKNRTLARAFQEFARFGALAAILASSSVTYANIVGPYTADPSTLHLYHLDETAVVADFATSGGTNLTAFGNGAALGSNSFSGFGTALSTYDGGPNGIAAADKDAILATRTPINNAPTLMTYADPVTGAFTIETIVRIDFDPLANLGPTAAGGNGRNAPMHIIDAESTANAARIWQMRLDPIGLVPGADGYTTNLAYPALEFINVHGAVAPVENFITPIPTNGPDAIVSNGWFHVAITFNGSPNTASNLNVYWTRVDSSRTAAHLIGSRTMINRLPSGQAPNFSLGNVARNTPNGNFVGLIDEVRLSSVARGASGMMFAPDAVVITTQPNSTFATAGDTVSLTSLASGGQPIYYQWQLNGANLPGATNTTLTFSNIDSSIAGSYRLVATNSATSATSAVAIVRVGNSFGELFNTGVGDNHVSLSGSSIDPHWKLTYSDDPLYPGPSAYVISAPPASYLANNSSSVWLSPSDGGNSPGGIYIYQTSFLLDTVDPTNAQLTVNWGTDNAGLDVMLNGTSFGFTNGAFASLSQFVITNGFFLGSNTLVCVVSNAPGTGINPTGFRAELRGVALPLPTSSPTVVAPPSDVTSYSSQSATFAVAAAGSGPLAYQWYFGASPLSGQTNRILVLAGLTTAQSGMYSVTITNSAGSTNASAMLSVIAPPALAWLGIGGGDWDTSTVNWLDTSSMLNVPFATSDDVIFDSRGSAVSTVNIPGAVTPNSITVNSDTDYTFSGAGPISGIITLKKTGTGTLILDTSANSYGGTTLIDGGTVQVGNNDGNGTLGISSVTNNSMLSFARSDAFIVSNPISGTGAVAMVGYGNVQLVGNNSYTGPTLINSGILTARKPTALGTADSGTIVASGGQLFIDQAIDIPSEPVTINGSGPFGDGALRKGGANVSAFGGPITLASDSGIKVDGNSTFNITNASGITSTNAGIFVQADAGGRGVVLGSISLGSGSFTMQGAGTFVLAGTNNNWTGGSFIYGGTLQIGNGDATGSLPDGALDNEATLAFSSSANLVINTVISGAGGLNQIGAGRVTLTGDNQYFGATRITGTGALRAASNTSIGAGTVTIGAAQTDTSRLELIGGITLQNAITIFPRAFGAQDNPANIVNVSGTNVVSAPSSIIIPTGGNLLTLQSDSGLLIMSNGVTAGGAGRVFVMKGAADGEIYGNLDQSGANSLITYKLDAGKWTLYGANTASGITTISNGTLVVNGTMGTNVLTVAGGTLSGNGQISGPVVVNAGGKLSPGSGIGVLTINNSLTLQAGSTCSFETVSGPGASDLVLGLSSVTFGGTLAITNIGLAWVAGDGIKLFDATNYSGAFSAIVPATPGPGLSWSTSTMTSDGILRVVSSATPPTITSATITGGNFVLTGSGGAGAAGQTYIVITSTNIAAPLSTWTTAATNMFDGTGHFAYTNAVTSGSPGRFFGLHVPTN